MIGRSHLSKCTYVVVFLLVVSLASTPLVFPLSPFPVEGTDKSGRELQSVRYKRMQQERKQKKEEDRDRKLEKYHARHTAVRKQVELIAPYWAIGGGFESTLVIANTFPRSIEVTPVVYSNTGQKIPARKITLSKMATETIALRDLTGFEGYGQIALHFHGESLEVHASIVVTNSAQSTSVNHAFEKRSNYASSRLDGVFYVPSTSTQSRVAVSNTSDNPVDVAVAVYEEVPAAHAAGPSRPVLLGAHETQLLDLRPFLTRGSSNGQAVAATVTHSGAPGDVLVHGMITGSDGFSSNIRFLEPSNITELDLTSPIYQRNNLRPLVLLSNTGNETSNVQLIASYTIDEQSRETVLFSKTVERRSTAHLDLSPQLSSIPQNARNLGLRIVDSGKRRGILADVLLVDAFGSQVLQLFPKGFAGEVHPSHGFPFYIGTGMNTIVTVANPSQTEEIQYSLHLYFDDGKTYTYSDTVLKAGEIKHIEVRALRDDQVPGQRKALIPKTVTHGQGKVHFRPKAGSSKTGNTAASKHASHGGGHHGGASRMGGVAGATIIDEARQMSFATICMPVCPFDGEELEVYISDVYGGYIEGAVGSSYNVDLYVQSWDGSYLYVNNINWTNYDSSVVNAWANSIELVGPGFTYMDFEAQLGTYYWGCFDCIYQGDQYYYCTEGMYVPITITGWIDVYSYGYQISITDVQLDELGDDGSVTVFTDGPYWLGDQQLVVTTQYEYDHGEGDSGQGQVTLFEGVVGLGTLTLPFRENGVDHVPAGTYVRADAVYSTAPPAMYAMQEDVPAIPVRFRLGNISYPSPGVLRVIYAWESSTATNNNPRMNELGRCRVGEYVDFPGMGTYNPNTMRIEFVWPLPWWGDANGGSIGSDDPYMVDVPGRDGAFFDDHSPLLLRPPANHVVGTSVVSDQIYRFKCTNYYNDSWQNLESNTITRTIDSNGNGGWRFDLVKTNATNGNIQGHAIIDPIPPGGIQ